MHCPNCGLINPPTAQRCDCGYDFTSHTIKELPGRTAIPKTQGQQLAREYAVCCGIVALLLWILAEIAGKFGETMFRTGLFIAARMFPDVGTHDPRILLVVAIAFLIDTAIYGFVTFCAWRTLKSLVR